MSIHILDNGTCVIGAGGIWLPGCYENEKAARFSFRISDDEKARLRDEAISRGDGITTWKDIQKARKGAEA